MNRIDKVVRVVKKNNDDGNIKYFLSLSHADRLEHLEMLRTEYIKWKNSNDPKSRLQRVYSITKRA